MTGNGSLPGKKRLACQMQHHGRVFTDGVQHHRVIELGGDLADDVDAFRLQLFQMRQFVDHGYSRDNVLLWRAFGLYRARHFIMSPDSIQWPA